MRVVDNVILAALRASGVDTHDGLVEVDTSTSIVAYDTPYVVYYSSVGDDDDENPRLIGRHTRRSVFFTVIYVGLDRNQTKWAGEKVRAVLQDNRFTIPGYRSWPAQLEESQRVRRDDDAIRPDGSPLFYGVDSYSISLMLNHQGAIHV